MKMIESIQVIKTADGSNTFYHKEFNEIYHSRHGAYAEAMHVFIEAGLNYASNHFKDLHILEIGFGSGLNCFLTNVHQSKGTSIEYDGLDTLPLPWSLIEKLAINHPSFNNKISVYKQIIDAHWNESTLIDKMFSLKKIAKSLLNLPLQKKYNLIYFDAFAPTAQPEMWTLDVFNHLSENTMQGGVLVTYCAKGQVRRNMIEAGFRVEKIAGPPGKREMLRAVKN